MNKKNDINDSQSHRAEDLPLKKGRSNKLLEKRNECLAARYHYYNQFTDKRYVAIMQHLSDEFFLSPSTIQDLLQALADQLHELKETNPRKAYFENRWPQLVW